MLGNLIDVALLKGKSPYCHSRVVAGHENMGSEDARRNLIKVTFVCRCMQGRIAIVVAREKELMRQFLPRNFIELPGFSGCVDRGKTGLTRPDQCLVIEKGRRDLIQMPCNCRRMNDRIARVCCFEQRLARNESFRNLIEMPVESGDVQGGLAANIPIAD